MNQRRNIIWTLAVVAALAAGVYILIRFDPMRSGVYPKCVFYQITGWYCPGCGAARAFHALLHGRFLEALDYNPLLVLSLPVLVVMVVMEFIGWFRDRRYGLLRMWQAVALVALIVVYTILRNLPIEPFTYLAP